MGISIGIKTCTISHPVTLTKKNSDCLQKAKYLTIMQYDTDGLSEEFPMDELDRRLIALLRSNGPVARLRPSPRPQGLARDGAESYRQADGRGAILGFTVRLHPETSTAACGRSMFDRRVRPPGAAVMRALHGFPEVRSVHTQNGRWDV